MNNRSDMYVSLASLAGALGYLKDSRVQFALYVINSFRKDDSIAEKHYARIIRFLKSTPEYHAMQASKNYPFESPNISLAGEIPVGSIYHPVSKGISYYGLNKSEINQNLLCCGRAGAGKTSLISIILSGLIKQGIPFLCIDFKRDYASFIHNDKDMYVFNWKTFLFNPLLPPPGTDRIAWNQIFCDIFFHSCFNSSSIPTAAKSVFLDLLCGLTDRNSLLTMHDLDNAMDEVLASSRISSGYKERIRTSQSRIKAMMRVLGPMFSNSYRLEYLLDRRVVLMLDGLTVEMQSFLITALFHWIFTYRMNACQRGGLKHCMVFDEAKMVFSSELASGASPISRLISTSRESGQGLILGEQMPSCLGHAVLANLYTQICLSLSAQQDIQSMSYAMGLDNNQRAMLNNLPLRTGVCKMADRYSKPFMFRIPHILLNKNISEAEIQEYMKQKIESLETVYSSHVSTDQNTADDVAAPDDSSSNETDKGSEALSEDESLVLNDVRNRPFVNVSTRFTDLSLTNYMGNKICRSLIQKGLMKEWKIKVSAKGRTHVFYELTESGEKLGGCQNLASGKGGFLHCFQQKRISEFFRKQGYEAEIEAFRNGKAVDVGLVMEGKRIAIEIVCSNPDKEGSNIIKDIEAGWSEIWILCSSEEFLEDVENIWESIKTSYPSEIHVEFHLLTDSRFFEMTE